MSKLPNKTQGLASSTLLCLSPASSLGTLSPPQVPPQWKAGLRFGCKPHTEPVTAAAAAGALSPPVPDARSWRWQCKPGSWELAQVSTVPVCIPPWINHIPEMRNMTLVPSSAR